MLEQLKKVKIEDLGLKSDVEAIELVKKLKSAVSSIGYYTDGTVGYIIGDFEELPLYNLIAKQRIDELEQQVNQINEKIMFLQQQLSQIQLSNTQPIEQREQKEETTETIQFPHFQNPLDEEPKSLQSSQHKIIRGFTFKKREQQEEIEEEKQTVPFTTYSFRCPSCNSVFTVDVPKNRKLDYLKCKNCGHEIYKRKRLFSKKKATAIAIACFTAFIVWLMI
ncbi:MAG: hypothetical protein ACKD6O_08070 [Candidatus Bathyarchaeota archaeon]